MGAFREMPPDFAEFAALPLRTLEIRYGAARNVLARWRRELGVVVRPGAPKGNGNAVRNCRQGKQTHGIDDHDAIRTCLNCTAPRCSGKCRRVR